MKIQLVLDINKLYVPKENVEASGQMTINLECTPAELFDCNQHYPEQIRAFKEFIRKE